MSSSVYAGLGSLLVALFIWLRKPKASTAPLPPGPKPLPLVGNIKDLTPKELWLPATRWAKQYGAVVYTHVFGQSLVFLNTPEAASELLDKRGTIHSDRLCFVMVGDLCGCKDMMAFTDYGDKFKRRRRIMHKALGAQAIPMYHPRLISETSAFLRHLIADPLNLLKHARRYAGGSSLSVIYGHEVVSDNDEFLRQSEECVDLLANDITSGGGIWAVDVFNFLQHLPASLPGMGFKRKAAVWKALIDDWVDKPYEYLKAAMKLGNYKANFCSTMLEGQVGSVTAEFDMDLKWTANTIYGGSIDTTMTTISHFLLQMMEHPEVAEKAQKEIDAVVGDERLPKFEDRHLLPYVEAVFDETLRWAASAPLGLPHRSRESDIYNGMLIPKGSLILANIWAITRDESIYEDPYTFKPERFFDRVDDAAKRRRNPKNYVFGFGRRQCPGMYLVDSSIWLLIVNMLATLRMSKAVDEAGKVIEPEYTFENSFFRVPTPFKCDIRPRSEKALILLKQLENL